MMDTVPVRAAPPGYCDIAQPLEWRSRYDGLVAIAQIGDKAVAGISGPWSGKYALTTGGTEYPCSKFASTSAC